MAAKYFKSNRPPILQFEPIANLFYTYLLHEDPCEHYYCISINRVGFVKGFAGMFYETDGYTCSRASR